KKEIEDNVPNIVVLGSGGGLRALIALLGTLVELKKQNFLDAVPVIWCMSLLYGDGKWSENLMSLEKELCKNLSTVSWNIAKAEESLVESSKDEHYSLTDFWASCFVYKILQQVRKDWNKPLPIYAAVDKETLRQEGENSPGKIWVSSLTVC
uniref:PLA2c domain-containing protein n=1 Tax=Strix occidentalis caurina TaxID=311401 RepID=A0A8D0FS80_STROC